jgi:hypothetical protein
MIPRVSSRLRRSALLASAALGLVLPACGARSDLDVPPPVPPGPECNVTADCPGAGDLCSPVECRPYSEDQGAGGARAGGHCVVLEPVDCDDHDPCTADQCDGATGACHYALATHDLDGDGHRAPLPGKLPGAPDACGDDCDDTNGAAHPGGQETCDGVDNDCNGIVDDDATFVPLVDQPIRISGDIAPSGTGGLAWSGSSYAAIYGGQTQHYDMYETMLSPLGETLPPGEHRVTAVSSDSSGGPVVWIGDRYGLAWQDRRDSDYEVYFTLLKEDGSKAIADTRLTYAGGFSINVSLTYDGTDFVAVWQDGRNGYFDLYAQRVSVDGNPIGSNVQLTETTGTDSESPSVAAGLATTGVAWSSGDAGLQRIVFQSFGPDLAPKSGRVVLTTGDTQAVFPTVVWNKPHGAEPGSYVVAWFDRTANPKAIYGAVVNEAGEVLVAPKPLTDPGAFRSRYPFLRPLGDRLLLVYSDDRDQNDGYELYARMIDDHLGPLGPEQRLTNAPRDSINPIAAFGPDGDVGVLFRDDRINGEHHMFFTRLGCVTGAL